MSNRPLSISPDGSTRDAFQLGKYRQRLRENPGDQAAQSMIEYYENMGVIRQQMEADPAWREHNLEYDMRSTEWFVAKCQNHDYAQNVYAAICNNSFRKREVMSILREDTWSASWRRAGGIVADLQGRGDYLDWYCSGIGDKVDQFSRYVGESHVTDEVREDLEKLGWMVLDDCNDD
jgi:hypothetical protein